MDLFSKFAKVYRVLDSNAYRETVTSVEKVATATLGVLADESAEEQAQLLERVTNLGEKLNDAVSQETPLVVALALLTAIRVLHQSIQELADNSRTAR